MFFEYKHQTLYWKNLNLERLLENIRCKLEKNYEYLGPFYLYHKKILHERISLFTDVFPGYQLYFAVKSLSNIHILRELRPYRQVGLDVVSGGEIYRGIQAGFSGKQMVFAGVGKTAEEIRLAAAHGIKSIHVESLSELKKIVEISHEGAQTISVALRLNPDIAAPTHKYIETGKGDSKFGIDTKEIDEALSLLRSSERVRLSGLHVHLGSQLMEIEPYQNAFSFLERFIKKHELFKIKTLSLGGGFGIDYERVFTNDEVREFPLAGLARSLNEHNQEGYEISFEPGRFISAPAGVLVSRVIYIKPKKDRYIAITDAGMSELIRPALYGAHHKILNVSLHTKDKKKYDIVGPICETGDFFSKGAHLYSLQENDHLVITQAGAYAASMSSHYNSRPLIPEVLAGGEDDFQIIRRPQKKEELYECEAFIP